MKALVRKTGCIVIGLAVMAGAFAGDTSASVLLNGKQFLVVGMSTGAIAVYDDIFSFEEDGSFNMKKIASYGSGEYFEVLPGLFYFYFTTRSGTDVQIVTGLGLTLPPFIFGTGYFMLDYEVKPTVFMGMEVFQQEENHQ